MDAGNRKAPDNPREKASCISALFFIWTYKILKDGYSRIFDTQDICNPLTEDLSNVLGDRIEAQWNKAVANAKKKNKTPSLLVTIFRTFGQEYLCLGLIHVVSDIIVQLLRPFCLGLLLSYFRKGSTTTWDTAAIAAAGISGCSVLTTIFGQHYLAKSLCIGMKVRVACVSLVYRKCLKLGRTALGDISPGQVVNLVSNDVSRFDLVTVTSHFMWSAPILACIVAVILYYEIGWPGLVGILVVFIVVPLLSFVGSLTSRYRLRIALKTDERVRLTDEVINGIQVIKMYAWEKPFSKLVAAARKAELDIVKKTTFLRGLYMTFNLSTVRIALFSALLAVTLSGGHLNAEKVFVVAAYFNSLTQTFSGMFVRGFAEISECRVSIRRLQGFLMRNEYKSQVKISASDIDNNIGGDKAIDKVVVRDVSASWNPDSSDSNTLSSINCNFKNGTLIGVVGSVGSGKSSFLQLLLGEIEIVKGNIEIRGSLSYASQEPWVFSGSIRQNILFGQEFDRKRYRKVTKVCALERDFELFPHGDMTLVGERGASLSGGQKARINLARAVYKDSDVYLLDDPLSAVDTHVGKHLFNDCIKGYLSNKTVILVTHQLQYMNSVDHVILLNNGSIQIQGSYDELRKSDLDYAALISQGDEKTESVPEEILKPEEHAVLTRMISTTSITSFQSSAFEDGSVDDDAPVPELEPEVVRPGGRSVYLNYLRSGTNLCVILIVVILFIITQALASGADYFVSFWTRLEEQREIDKEAGIEDSIWPSTWLAGVQGSLAISVLFVGIIRATVFCVTCMKCSSGLHDKMFQSVIGTSISFFNNNPSGRILNRFSKDLGMIDEWVPKCLLDVIQVCCSITGALVITAVVNPIFIIPIIIIGGLSVFARRIFIKTSKNLKRLEGIARSPVFSHLNTTLQGLPTVRALGAQSILQKEFDNHQDLHTGSMFLFIYTSSGFTVVLDVLCLIFITLVTFSFLQYGPSATFGAKAGLAITQAISIAGYLQWGMRASAEIANQMTATERVLEYSTLPKEEVDTKSKKGKDDIGNWPTEGKIVMDHMYLSYTPDDPPVLKDVCLEIKPRDKVGIVGRTGAGKSSLIQAMFRMSNMEGKIIIDSIDTNTLTLECLRSHISIIPQDPVLFSGTMRRNLDPFEEYPDYVLWRALDEVELREALKEEFGLQTRVMDGGSNFSLGQRQLVCLARAIVRNNKILVMDEATANVDPQTDALIQKTIRDKFSECTVLTIAHRLNTVMDSDKVLVMDAGKVMEFDHPHNLLQDANGYFSKLVQETGAAMTEHLTEVARMNYLQRR